MYLALGLLFIISHAAAGSDAAPADTAAPATDAPVETTAAATDAPVETFPPLPDVQGAADDLADQLKADEDSIQSLVGKLADAMAAASKDAQAQVAGDAAQLKTDMGDASSMLRELMGQLKTDMDDFDAMNKEYDDKMKKGKMTAKKNYSEKKDEAQNGLSDVKSVGQAVKFQEKENKNLVKLLSKIEDELAAIAKKEEEAEAKAAADKAAADKAAADAAAATDAPAAPAADDAAPAAVPEAKAIVLIPGDNEQVSIAVVLLLFLGLSVIATSGYYMLNKYHNPMHESRGWTSLSSASETDSLVNLGDYYQSSTPWLSNKNK